MLRKILTSSLITLVAIGGFFVNIEKHESPINQSVSYEISSVTEVHAATGDATDINKMLNGAVNGINATLSVLTVIVSPAIMLAGWLMSPDWTSGDLFGLREVMHKLWITVSNILYFVYAVLLIVIALATMFNQEKFGYKVMLPKLALGIILVPFTWWFVQWTISLASVVTASVISIPTDTIKDKTNDWTNQSIIPKDILVTDVNNELAGTGASGVQSCAKDKTKCMTPKDFLSNSSGMYGHLIVYAYGVFKLNEVKNLSTGTDVVKNIGQIIHQTVIAAIMFLVFGILVIALVFMLMMRAIKLWMYAIFSPLFTLHFVVGKDILGDKLDDFSLKEFIGLAFVPAVVGITLSFGLVIVSAIQGDGSKITSTPCTPTLLKGDGCEILGIMGNPSNKIIRKIKPDLTGDLSGPPSYISENIVKFGDINFTFRGKITGGIDYDKEASSASNVTSVISSAGGIFGTIVVDIIALIFIWASFMAAKGVSKAVDAAVQPFEQMGKKIGDLGKSLPKYTPLPIPGGSIRGAEKATESIQGMLHAHAEKKYEESATGKFLSNLNPKISLDPEDVAKISRVNSIDESHQFMGEASTVLRDIKNKGKGEAIIHNPQLQKTIDKLIKIGKDDKFDASLMESKMGISYQAAQKIGTIAKDNSLNDEAKRKLIAALATGASYTAIDGSGSIKAAEDHLKSGGGGNNSSSGAANNTFIQPFFKNSDEKPSITIGGNTVEIDTEGKITENIESLKDVKSGMTKEEFINQLMKSGRLSLSDAGNMANQLQGQYKNFFTE